MGARDRWIPRQMVQVEQKRLLELKRSIQGDLKKLVLSYRRMENLSRDLKHRAKTATDDLQKTRSRLRSVQWDLRASQRREANLLNLVLTGLKEPLDIIVQHIGELFATQESDRTDGSSDIKVDRLRSEVQRLRQIVADLMAASAVQLGEARLKQEQVDVKELVNRVLEEHRQTAHGQQIGLSGKFAEPLPRVLGDRQQLQLALNHLVDNAIAHSPTGGMVTIEANGKQTRDRVSVSIIDMRPDALDENTLQFLRDQSLGQKRLENGIRGFDLELMAAAHIIDLLHGRIDVTSRPGKETVLTLTLPTGSFAERMY
jgi:K+-sensing histidine kinase KdpD